MTAIHPPFHIDSLGYVVDGHGKRILNYVAGNEDICKEIVMRLNSGLRPARSDIEIVRETEQLARVMLKFIGTGYEYTGDLPIFDVASNPPISSDIDHDIPTKKRGKGAPSDGYAALYHRLKAAWDAACEAQELLTATDPNDALSGLSEVEIALLRADATGAEIWIKQQFPNATLIEVTGIDLRALNAYEKHEVEGFSIRYRVLKNRNNNLEFVEWTTL